MTEEQAQRSTFRTTHTIDLITTRYAGAANCVAPAFLLCRFLVKTFLLCVNRQIAKLMQFYTISLHIVKSHVSIFTIVPAQLCSKNNAFACHFEGIAMQNQGNCDAKPIVSLPKMQHFSVRNAAFCIAISWVLHR